MFKGIYGNFGFKIFWLNNILSILWLLGVPGCIYGNFCKIIAYGASFFAYYGIFQRNSVQAAYWHDPLNQKVYEKYNKFLADINQEIVSYF